MEKGQRDREIKERRKGRIMKGGRDGEMGDGEMKGRERKM